MPRAAPVKIDDPVLRDLLARYGEGGISTAEPASPPKPVERPVPPERREFPDPQVDERVLALRAQLAGIVSDSNGTSAQPIAQPVAPPRPTAADPNAGPFVPRAPATIDQLGLLNEDVENLVLKFLLHRGSAAGRQLADQLGLPFSLMEKVLFAMKADQAVAQKGSAAMGDYIYQLTPKGDDDAHRVYKHCSYYGTAPVPLEDYVASVQAQSLRRQQPTQSDLEAVFEDLLVAPDLRNRIGQALFAGKGFFLYGSPGNGKTSIAERVARAYGQTIWIPRAVYVAGEIVRLYDPCNHELVSQDIPNKPNEAIDRRWVCIRRPTVIAGGELTMDRLEISVNKGSGINEAPLQLKSNCGVLVIDDFGRQRMGVAELLNRWIVPLDRRYDFLSLPSGKTIQVPFDQLLIFSTNLEPRELVDEAFLRRISFKIDVPDPTLDIFRKLLVMYAEKIGCKYEEAHVEHMIHEHYLRAKRPFRACHARDLLDHVRSYCGYHGKPLAMTREAFDAAVKNYFSLMTG